MVGEGTDLFLFPEFPDSVDCLLVQVFPNLCQFCFRVTPAPVARAKSQLGNSIGAVRN